MTASGCREHGEYQDRNCGEQRVGVRLRPERRVDREREQRADRDAFADNEPAHFCLMTPFRNRRLAALSERFEKVRLRV